MKREENLKRRLLKIQNGLYFKAEEFFSDKDFILLFMHRRPLLSKEQLIGRVLDFFVSLEIRRSNLFKAVHRHLERKLKRKQKHI